MQNAPHTSLAPHLLGGELDARSSPSQSWAPGYLLPDHLAPGDIVTGTYRTRSGQLETLAAEYIGYSNRTAELHFRNGHLITLPDNVEFSNLHRIKGPGGPAGAVSLHIDPRDYV